MASPGSEETPLLKQYRAAKADHPGAIMMFRIGDFYEMLEGDAELAARELELTLTSKAMGKAGRLPLAGVPHHAVESYIARLVRRGYHVAVCDQVEDPSVAKGLVRREVIRVVTPGTYASADGRSNTYLAAVSGRGVAIGDLLTGELHVGVFSDDSGLEAALARFRPSELLVAEDVEPSRASWLAETVPGIFVTRRPAWQFGGSYASDLLKRHFGVATLAGLGFADDGADTAATGSLLSYLTATQKSALEHINNVSRLDADEALALDAATLLQLEIVDSPTRDTQATLRAVLDDAVTGMGSRLVARRLTAPLSRPEAIRARLDRVQVLVEDGELRDAARTTLKRVHDLDRLAGRVSLGTLTPREAVGLAGSLESVGLLRTLAAHPALADLAAALDPLPDVSGRIRASLVDEPPIEFGAGPLFRDGVVPELDALRHGSRDSREWIAALQARERERTGITSLKVGFNNVFGYYIEVTKSNLAKVPEEYRRKQTTATGERYITEELAHHEDIVLRANERITALEEKLFARLRDELRPHLAALQAVAAAVAELDLTAAFAGVAVARGYCRPEIVNAEPPVFRVKAGRHPVVEAIRAEAEAFVPNDITLDAATRFLLITGPNMAGKSTYIRQAALIALMAQCGSYVPAESCTLAPFTGIHARIGASDRLARGLSTFMVEMVEAAHILRHATRRSLVVLDELGRGTSTYDGLSLAWAIVEALAGRGCAALFATHYHELTRLGREIPGVGNATVAVKEWGDRIHFLHEIRPGAADRSYGIQVAAIAGVPPAVLDRARGILTRLELGEMAGEASGDDGQLSFFSPSPARHPGEEEALAALRASDPDNLTPRDALALVAKLREKLP